MGFAEKEENLDIEKLIPHRAPMLLLDRMVSLEENKAVAEKFIEEDSFFLQGHFPQYPVVPGIITCECLFQTGAALLAEETPSAGVPVVSRVDNVRLRSLVRAGDTLRLEVEITDRVAGAIFLKGVARVDGKAVVSCEFRCSMAPVPTE